jgi:hypothetical protein
MTEATLADSFSAGITTSTRRLVTEVLDTRSL